MLEYIYTIAATTTQPLTSKSTITRFGLLKSFRSCVDVARLTSSWPYNNPKRVKCRGSQDMAVNTLGSAHASM